MVMRVVYNGFVPIFVLFISYSSLILLKTPNPILLITAGFLFLVCIFLKDKLPPLLTYLMTLFFLGVFHWYSHLNWCSVLYLIMVAKPLYRSFELKKSVLISLLFIFEYTLIRLSYVPSTMYNILVSILDILTAVVLVFIVEYFRHAESENQLLKNDKLHLLTHDALTNLLNYQEYHKRIHHLFIKNVSFIHVLIDCKNFKAMNDEQGILVGNETLKNFASYLSNSFPEAIAIARYGGDEFAVVLNAHTANPQQITETLHDQMPQSLNMKITFSYVTFPDETANMDQLFSLAEDRLFQIKREQWLKREEHLFRSEKLKVIGELAAGMAHEIRNPLTAIKGFLQLAKSNEYSVKPWYGVLESEIARMAELTAEFLQFSKPHISNLKIHALQDCILRVVQLTESQALLHGHEIEYTDNDPKPLYINMDKDKIVQVLINIIKNGFEAMDDKGRIRIRLSEKENHAVIEIEDTGKGISESELEQIFHPFYTTKQNGTGLGLSICHKIIQDHHGKMDVQSIIGQGTTFRITLPTTKLESI